MITDDVPMGVAPAAALGHVKLVMLLNDVSLRRLIPDELAKGFGFFQGKPRSACSPVAVTPDALGAAWRDGKLHGALRSAINGKELGHPDAGVEMQFDFGRLIAHAARTRPLAAGTIVGSGTVSNRTARPARPASPRSARSRPSTTARRRPVFSSSATASASRCWTPAAARSSARSTRRSCATSPDPAA